MSYRDLTVGAYAKFQDLIACETTPPPVPFLEQAHREHPHDLRYDWQERDFRRELINSFNEYAVYVWRLTLWEKVLRDYGDEEVIELRMEFTSLPFEYCLSAPYKFKSRVIFCATQLCYTQALADKLVLAASLHPDEKIDINSLEGAAKHWLSGPRLVKALRDVDAPQYRSATGNYRNKSQHRHPQRLDHGLTASAVRTFSPTGSVNYVLCQSAPLAAREVLPVLATEADFMKTAFLSYCHLVEEQTAIKNET
ncbi:hypothetical protein [Nitrosospira sp. Is2]|uniref:hypothetical protein n=1 Tax=Nitrosospira sp. Is2 TaxID=3080532 RepID=UPI002953DA27|nr:hypothetical protein [Nitrosospira sp. Is2]WON74780.1 hypothetical protein R5L00_04645 [Nitrosospira sp. Is2]